MTSSPTLDKMPRPPSSHGNWTVSLTTERRNKGTIDNYDVTKRARLTTSDSPRDTRVTPRERNRELHSHIKMNNVEYTCTDCHENIATEHRYLEHKAQNHLGQRWKCFACKRYFVRRLDRTLLRQVGDRWACCIYRSACPMVYFPSVEFLGAAILMFRSIARNITPFQHRNAFIQHTKEKTTVVTDREPG